MAVADALAGGLGQGVLDELDGRRVPPVGHDLQLGADVGVHLGDQVGRAGQGAFDVGGPAGQLLLDDRGDQVVLGAEVLVQARPGQPHPAGQGGQ
ncbi:hypothetical protein GCM10009678_35590 [Actinomadura kijaniata]